MYVFGKSSLALIFSTNLTVQHLSFLFHACAAARINPRNKHAYKRPTCRRAVREFIFTHVCLNQYKIANNNTHEWMCTYIHVPRHCMSFVLMCKLQRFITLCVTFVSLMRKTFI